MKSKQRQILNEINIDFKRDHETQDEYVARKIKQITETCSKYMKHTGTKGYVLGLSGGIDSFTCAALLGSAMSKDGGELRLFMLPNKEQSDIEDSKECAKVLLELFPDVITCETISIENAFAGVKQDISKSKFFDDADKYSMGNTAARLRMVEQYALARGYLVAGTDHATENITGYYTKHGDGASDFNPLDGLIKPDIYEIAKRFNAPSCVLTKAPAAGLGISTCDEDELGVSYDDLAQFLKGYVIDASKVQRIFNLYDVSMHKRNPTASPLNVWWSKSSKVVTHIFLSCDLMHEDHEAELYENITTFMEEQPYHRVFYVQSEGHVIPNCFYNLSKAVNTPIRRYNVFDKTADSQTINAKNDVFGVLKFNIGSCVVLSGCMVKVKELSKDLAKNGFEVYVLNGGISNEIEDMSELIDVGVKII